MIFNEHSNLEGQHAFLGASQYRWLNYSEEDLRGAYLRSYAQQIGTILHELAKDLISSRIKVNKMDILKERRMQDFDYLPVTVFQNGNWRPEYHHVQWA